MTMLTIKCKRIFDGLVIVALFEQDDDFVSDHLICEMLVQFPFTFMYVIVMNDSTMQLKASITMATYLVTNSSMIEDCIL